MRVPSGRSLGPTPSLVAFWLLAHTTAKSLSGGSKMDSGLASRNTSLIPHQVYIRLLAVAMGQDAYLQWTNKINSNMLLERQF